MDKIENFLIKQNQIIDDDREKTLVSLGLTEKEYSPDGKESYLYNKHDYVNGEKKYYREKAISVTEEQWNMIIEKTKKVAEIKKKEEQEKESRRKQYSTIKKLLPIFEKEKNEWITEEQAKIDTGKSKLSLVLRVIAWIIGFVGVIFGIVVTFSTGEFIPFLITIFLVIIEMILFLALAEILDYLAELTSIARNGFKYDESQR